MKTSNPTLIPTLCQETCKCTFIKQSRERLISQESLIWCLHRAKLSYHCKVQENRSLPAYMSEAVVAEMQNGWDLNKLKTGNKETLKGTGVFN